MVVNENHYGNYIAKIAHSQEKILIIMCDYYAARQGVAAALRLGRTQKAARGACGGGVVLDYFIQPAFQPESF